MVKSPAVLHSALLFSFFTLFLAVLPPLTFAQPYTIEPQPAKNQILPEPIHEYLQPTPIVIGSTQPQCVSAGCSGELCVNAITGPKNSTCEWREEYACYHQATCEVQPNGACGWTMTPELTACLNDHQSQPLPQLTAIPLPQPQPTFISQPYPTLLPIPTAQPKPIEICTLYCPEGTILTPGCQCVSGPVVEPGPSLSPAPSPNLNPNHPLLTFRLRMRQILRQFYLRFSLPR